MGRRSTIEELVVTVAAVANRNAQDHVEDGDGDEGDPKGAHEADHRRPAALHGLRRQLLLLGVGHHPRTT